MKPKNTFSLDIALDADTGQLRALRDRNTQRDILNFAAGRELAWNDVPLNPVACDIREANGEHLTVMQAVIPTGYGTGATLRIRRMISRGGVGLRPGTPNSVHIRYELLRVPNVPAPDGLDYIWQPPVESSLRLDALTVLNAPVTWFGPETHMRALALGGTGPREHVSLEDGPVDAVLPWLRTGFRTEFPGQSTVGGALYYHPGTEEWVWVMVRRPNTTGRVLFGKDRHAYRFGYHTDIALGSEVFAPAVSVYWGKGMDAADKVLADQFDLYEEPPAWAWNTVWFWLHPIWVRGMDFDRALDGAKAMMDTCGVNGFGLAMHDVPLSGNDIDVGSPAPCAYLGGNPGLRRLVDGIRKGGAHSFVWISRHGHRAESHGFADSWTIRGVDGKPIRLRNAPDTGVNIDILNCADPGFQAYIQDWIRYYVRDVGIDGLFWDSGFQPLPPDFGNKPYLRWPGQTNALAAEFYARMLRFGQSLSPDFFMWAEGISVDIPMNGFSVDAKTHGEHSGHRLMHRLAHAGRQRLMWRSAWPHDLASGFVMLNPYNDVGRDASVHAAAANDPMNQWVCRIVRERGVRKAVGLADGVSLLDEFVVTRPGFSGTVVVPSGLCHGTTLRHVLSGSAVRGRKTAAGTRFELAESGGYAMA